MTIQEIKKEMTDEWMSDSRVRDKWGIREGEKFEERFPTASVENLLFYIVALVIWTREKYHELWKEDIEATALATRYGTREWWKKVIQQWQYGDEVEILENGKIGYREVDESKRIVRYVAVVVGDREIYIKVAKEAGVRKVRLTDDEVASLQGYVNVIKPIGIHVRVQSMEACEISPYNVVYINSQYDKQEVLNNVKKAIEEYLSDVEFGGVLYKSKLVDVIQSVKGVVDTNMNCIIEDPNQVSWTEGGYYVAKGGYYEVKSWNISVRYEREIE